MAMARGLLMLRPATDMATAMVAMDMATARGLLRPAMVTATVMDMAMARGLLMLRPATDMATAMVAMDMATAMVAMDMATARGLLRPAMVTAMVMDMATT